MSRPPRDALAFGVLGGAFGAATVIAAGFGMTARVSGALAALAAASLGVASVRWAHEVAPDEPDDEDRVQRGPNQRQRRLILRTAAGTVAVLAIGGAVPAARRLDQATTRLKSTLWRDGVRVVDDRGRLLRVDDLVRGHLLTAYPEDSTDAIESQAVLIRESPERYTPASGRDDWTPGGVIAYSKLCTHMACPVGLYETRRGTLLCPCHQAVFDVLAAGEVLRGPARRPLPQLPLRVDDEGHLVARGDFSDAVGTGFWERP